LTDELAQRLYVGPGDSFGQRFYRLAAAVHEQPLQVNLGPTVPFTAAE
jgi:hypothetical protein